MLWWRRLMRRMRSWGVDEIKNVSRLWNASRSTVWNFPIGFFSVYSIDAIFLHTFAKFMAFFWKNLIMDKNEIVRKYKWFRVLRGFLRMLMYLICLIIILVIVYLLFHLDWIGIVEFIAQVFISILVNIDKLINLLEDQGIFSYIVVFVIIPFFLLFDSF